MANEQAQQEQRLDQLYHQVFQTGPAGQEVLQDLAAKYYDRTSFVAGDPHHTAFREGERNVILYILSRAGLNEKGGETR